MPSIYETNKYDEPRVDYIDMQTSGVFNKFMYFKYFMWIRFYFSLKYSWVNSSYLKNTPNSNTKIISSMYFKYSIWNR